MTITVDREQFEEALQQTIDLMSQDIKVMEDYSGRAMYGDKCVGIVCDIGCFAAFCASFGSFGDDWDWVGSARSDSMGLSTIWYWPGVQLEAGEE